MEMGDLVFPLTILANIAILVAVAFYLNKAKSNKRDDD